MLYQTFEDDRVSDLALGEEEALFARDMDGRLVRMDEATREQYDERVEIWFVGRESSIKVEVPRAVPSTDSQGIYRRDATGNTIPRATTIYEAARQAFVRAPDDAHPIPVLCHQEHLHPVGVCRVCSVQVGRRSKGRAIRLSRKLVPACQHRVEPGMVVYTIESAAPEPEHEGLRVQRSVRTVVELLVARSLHDGQRQDGRYANELRSLADRLEIKGTNPVIQRRPADRGDDDSSKVILVDHNNCILCNRCVRACNDVRPFRTIGRTGKGDRAAIGFDLNDPIGESSCVSCGECMISCPTGALTFKQPVQKWPDGVAPTGTVLAEELQSGHDLFHDLFHGLPFSFLKWNEGSVVRRELVDGEVLCNEGDFAKSAFIIESGQFEVLPRGDEAPKLCTVEDLILGEMACLSNQRRSATVKAKGAARVLEVGRNVLYMLSRNYHAQQALQRVYRQRALNAHFERAEIFGGLTPDQSRQCADFLRPRVKFVAVDPGVAICREGELATAFDMIRVGHVKVSQAAAAGEIVLDCMVPGRHFGEIAILSKLLPEVEARLPGNRVAGQRTATCTALDHVELVRVKAADLEALLTQYPDIRDRIARAAIAILDRNVRQVGDFHQPLREFVSQQLYLGQSLLVIDLESCTRCDECTKACADVHNKDHHNRLVRDGLRFDKYLVATSCRSCHDPACLVGCPVDAIHRSADTGALAIRIDEKLCIGCGLCAINCPFGCIQMTEPEGHGKAILRSAVTCDLCESVKGNRGPMCVYACPHQCAIRLDGRDFWQRVQGSDRPQDAYHPLEV